MIERKLRCDAPMHEHDNMGAGEVVAMFCYQTKKCIGACAAAFGGLETGISRRHWRKCFSDPAENL